MFRLNRNERSHWSGNGVHVESELVFMIGRNMQEAVRLVLEQGLGQAEAARRLGIAKGTLSNWVVAAKGGKDTSAIPGARSVAELEAEVARLRKALAQANMERDIIKKAAAYFAQESLPSTRG